MQVLVGDADAGKGIFLSAILGRKKIDPSTFSPLLGPVAPYSPLYIAQYAIF